MTGGGTEERGGSLGWVLAPLHTRAGCHGGHCARIRISILRVSYGILHENWLQPLNPLLVRFLCDGHKPVLRLC